MAVRSQLYYILLLSWWKAKTDYFVHYHINLSLELCAVSIPGFTTNKSLSTQRMWQGASTYGIKVMMTYGWRMRLSPGTLCNPLCGGADRWQQEDECYWLYSMLSKWRTIFSASQDTFHYGATSRLDSAKGCSAYYRKELKKFLCSLLHKLEGRNNTSNTSKSGLRFALCNLTGLCFRFCDHNYHLCTLQTLLPYAQCTLGYTDYMICWLTLACLTLETSKSIRSWVID